MKIHSSSFEHGKAIPATFAFGRPGTDGPVDLSDNRNPHLAWTGVPSAARSLVLLCVDPDVPTVPETVNREDREVPAEQPRGEFFHWVMVGLAAADGEIAEGACSDGVTPQGKLDPPGPAGSRQGLNDYTGWFDGDTDMGGRYFGYDGPCPPWNDAREHRYFFRLFALDTDALDLPDAFTGGDVLRAIQGHVLAEASLMGTYTLRRQAP
ncbi:MAG: YbhB/YbcL family Raf kinase inhibitor-like protein [Lysobacteraceae bacterium]